MTIEHVHNREMRYTLSNENLKVGDEVYPIASGRRRDDKTWVLHELNWEDYMTGFPDDPHTIRGIAMGDVTEYADVITDKGSSPEMCYYKVIKQEIQVKENKHLFPGYKWVELTEAAPGYSHKKYTWDTETNKWVKNK